MDAVAKSKGDATLHAVVVRACVLCGNPREQDKDCASCGNTEPAVIHDLGVIAAKYANPVKNILWQLFGRHVAAHRVRQANKELAHGNNG